MLTPLAVIAFGIDPKLYHVGIGVLGLVMFFVLPTIGFYGVLL
jgi:hypothetical protein